MIPREDGVVIGRRIRALLASVFAARLLMNTSLAKDLWRRAGNALISARNAVEAAERIVAAIRAAHPKLVSKSSQEDAI